MIRTLKFGCLLLGVRSLSCSYQFFSFESRIRAFQELTLINGIAFINSSLSSNSHSNMAEQGISQGTSGKHSDNSNENGLVLYYHHHSFYAQKVIMALYEKKIPFKKHLVDITKGEQYHPWFLSINPRGEVPVLKDGIKLIPDSARILDYLEDNFSNGETVRLIPNDQGVDVKKKIVHFKDLIDTLPANVITIGSIINSEFSSRLKYPFSLSAVRSHLKAADDNSSASLRALADKYPDSRDILLQKAINQDKKHNLVTDRTSYLGLLDQTAKVLDDVEKELATHTNTDKSDWWLCSDKFTVADIALTILLDRLSRIGLEEYFWGTAVNRPNIAKYYTRVQSRDSYKKTVPGPWADISIMLKEKAPWLFGIGLVAVIAAFLGGFLRK